MLKSPSVRFSALDFSSSETCGFRVNKENFTAMIMTVSVRILSKMLLVTVKTKTTKKSKQKKNIYIYILLDVHLNARDAPKDYIATMYIEALSWLPNETIYWSNSKTSVNTVY